MSMRRRLEKLESAMGSDPESPEIHFVDLREWPEGEQLAYGSGTDEERHALVRAHVPGVRDTDIVFIVESELALRGGGAG